MELKDLLVYMTQNGGSDLHLKPMRPPLVRIDGRLVPIGENPLKAAEVESMLYSILTPAQVQKLAQHQSVDLGYGLPGVARFRCNIFQQRGTLAGVFRNIPFKLKSIEDLSLPDVLETMIGYPSGMVLVTGPTGSGKSTTLAALIQSVSMTRPCHVVTVEDPIEFLFLDNKASISQREVGTDTPSFQEALRNAMRQDPDIIMIGEMRDLETVATAIGAAETGHLVFSTLHTNSAPQTIDRIIDMYPAAQQAQVRTQLSQVLRAIVSMKLVPANDGAGRLPVLEILVNSPKISSLIAQGEIKEIHEEIENSVAYYHMQTMNQSLIALLANGRLDYETALECSPDPEDFSFKLRKFFPSIEAKFREGIMPSPSDFSEVTGLVEVKRLYTELEATHRDQMQEKEGIIAQLDAEVAGLRTAQQELAAQLQKAKQEAQRIAAEANQKVATLNERIKDLNQRLQQAQQPPAPPPSGGFFKR